MGAPPNRPSHSTILLKSMALGIPPFTQPKPTKFPFLDGLTMFWLVVEPYPSEKYDFVSWDDEIPNIWKVIKAMFQTTNQCFTFISSPVFWLTPTRQLEASGPPSSRHGVRWASLNVLALATASGLWAPLRNTKLGMARQVTWQLLDRCVAKGDVCVSVSVYIYI